MLSTMPFRVWTARGSWRGRLAADAAGAVPGAVEVEWLAGMAGEGMASSGLVVTGAAGGRVGWRRWRAAGNGCWAALLAEDGVERFADGAQVPGHGRAGVCRGSGFDGVEDEPVLDVGGVLAVGHHIEGFGLVCEGVADVRHNAFEHLVAAGAGE